MDLGRGVSIISATILMGCANTPVEEELLSPSGRARLVDLVEVQVTADRPSAEFGSFISENATIGTLRGVAEGFAFGLLYPPSWMVGGPFFMAPVSGYFAGRCSKSVSTVEHPIEQLQRHVDAVGSAGFRLEMSLRLKQYADSSRDVGTEKPESVYALHVTQLVIALEGETRTKPSDEFCGPELSALAKWRLIRKSDGHEIEDWTTRCRSDAPVGTFAQWFSDSTMVRKDIDELLKELAHNAVKELSSGHYHTDCRLLDHELR